MTLQNLDDQVRDCLAHAQECAERARSVGDPRERAEWTALERHYLTLAHSIEFTERLGRFSYEAKRVAGTPVVATRTPTD